MTLRLAVIGVLMAVFGGVLGTWALTREDSDGQTTVAAGAVTGRPLDLAQLYGIGNPTGPNGDDDLTPVQQRIWERESQYLASQNQRRWTGIPLTVDTQKAQGETATFNILVVGDSFTWGSGQSDPAARWPEQLQAELNQRYGPGTFAVTRLAEPGTGTYQHVHWLETNPELVRKADVIVLGLVENDAVPRGEEHTYCNSDTEACPIPVVETSPEFLACYAGDRSRPNSESAESILSELDCDRDSLARTTGLPSGYEATLDIINGPLGPAYQNFVRRLMAAAGDTPLLVAPLEMWRGRWREVTAETIGEAFTSQGQAVLDMPHTKELFAKPWNPSIEVHTGDAHPGPAMAYTYALDIADAIEQAIPTASLVTSEQDKTDPTSLVRSYLPVDLDVQSGRETAQIVWDPDKANSTDARGPDQYAPCAGLGRPHGRIMLDPSLPDGTHLTITLNSGPAVDIFTAGYTNDRQHLVVAQGPVKVGTSIELTLAGLSTRGLLISPVNAPACSTDSPPELDPLSLTLTLN